MSSAQFDPCRQWLGIDAVEIGDPRRVLGILPSESDPLAVLRAAEARLSLLRSIAPGPFDMARNALIKRVEEAREAVLAQIAAMPRQPPPVGASFRMPPAPGAPAAPAPGSSLPRGAVSLPAVPRVPAPPVVPRPPAAASTPAAPWPADASGDDGGIVVKTRPVYRKQSSGAGVLLGLLLALAAAAGGLYWQWQSGKRLKSELAMTRDEKAARPAEATPPQARPSESERSVRKPRRRDSDDTTSDDAISTSKPVERRPKPRPPAEPEAPASEPKASIDAIVAKVAEPSEPAGPTESADVSKSDEPLPPAAPAKPAAPASPANDADDDATSLDPSLTKVLQALQNRQFDAAAGALRAAADLTEGRAAQDRLANWESLVNYARGFADYRSKALQTVQSGQDYDIGDSKMGIIEADDEKIVFRYKGRNQTRPRDNLPETIVMAVMGAWFDANPANDLYVGAYHATKPEPDLAKAREAWRQAERGGADASALLPLLDDAVLMKAAAADASGAGQ